jgi:hypothetical protein
MKMLWHFNQNNSGGSFVIDDEIGIGPHVFIESDTVDDAIEKAFSLGIYFNGVEEERDCACCGDRWHKPWSPEDEVDITEYSFYWHDTVYVHRSDGTIERIKKND